MSVPDRVILDTTVCKLREQLKKIRDRASQISEEDTKRVLITPLLQALQWDVFDIDEVRNEFRSQPQDNPVDYALFLNRTPCLFLEAKAINHSIDERKWVSQIVGYAATAGVEWCVLTNGDEYRFYNAHAPVDADKKLFKKVAISNAEQHRETVDTLDLISRERMGDKQINTLWQAHDVDSKVKTVLNELFQGDESLIRLIAKREPSLTQRDIRSSLQRVDIKVTFPVISHPPASSTPKVESTPELQNNVESGSQESRSNKRVTMKDLLVAGFLVAPVKLEAEYKKQTITAQVESDGSISFNGTSYPSPSAAGDAVTTGACNGWTFWSYRDQNGDLKSLHELRKRLKTP
ncbi:MAG: type I restriction enzyme HsdR N-terminal domain-containing protein [Magnetococcales bacterium]|nr:type I restriction enzyme HsdR N-terminal domain-containing protein [Magnetococcales bacterium]